MGQASHGDAGGMAEVEKEQRAASQHLSAHSGRGSECRGIGTHPACLLEREEILWETSTGEHRRQSVTRDVGRSATWHLFAGSLSTGRRDRADGSGYRRERRRDPGGSQGVEPPGFTGKSGHRGCFTHPKGAFQADCGSRGDYIWFVKGNQAQMEEDIRLWFEPDVQSIPGMNFPPFVYSTQSITEESLFCYLNPCCPAKAMLICHTPELPWYGMVFDALKA